MKPNEFLRRFLAIAGSAALAAPLAQAATLYWDGNDTTADSDGGAGTWDTSSTNWDTTPFAGSNAVWSNTNPDTAIFGRSSGTVTLGDDITVGGIRFDSSSFTINALTNAKTLTLGAANTTISFGTGATSGTITGTIASTGNFILSGNPTVANTLTLNNTGSGWSGTTTVNAGSTLLIGQTSQALNSTSAIAINGGTIQINRVNDAIAGAQISDGAGITFNGGGTLTFRHFSALSSKTENIGAVTVASGQANFDLINSTSSGGNSVVLSRLTRSVNTAAVTFANGGYGANQNNMLYKVTGAANTSAGEIVGSWATYGATSANQNDYAIYTSGDGTVTGAGIAASAESTWSTAHAATSNYTLTNAAGSAVDGLLTTTRNINTLRNTTTATAATATNGGAANLDYYTLAGNTFANGDVVSVSGTSGTTAGIPYYVVNVGTNGADTFQISTTPNLITPTLVNLGNTTAGQIAGGITLSAGNDLGTYGILNGSTTAVAIGGSGGVVTLPSTTSGNLFVTAGAGAIAIDAPITDNGAGVLSLVKSGNAALRLSGANTFTGDLTINAGALTFASLAAGMDGTGKNITFGGVGTLDTGVNGWDGGQLSVASGAVGTIAGRTTDFTSTTGSGTVIIGQGNVTVNLGNASAFTGNIRKDAGGNGGVIQFSALSDASGAGNLIFAGGSGDSNQRITMRYAGNSALTFNNRSIELLPKPNNWGYRNAILENNSANSAHIWVINTDLINQTDRNTEFTLSGSNTGNNEFAGVIGNSTRGTFYASPNPLANGPELNLYKTGTGKWIVSGGNTFTGRVLVNDGTLSVGDFTNSGVAGALGMGSLIQLGGSDRYFLNANNALLSSNSSGTLEYTGGAATSDRVFEIGDTLAGGTGGGTIANNGSGALTFTAATFNNTITGITATRTLTLGGSNTGNNEIQGVIQDNVASTGKVNLTKTDAGKWILSGTNTYTGTTTVSEGSLIINGSTSSTSLVSVASAGTLGGSGTVGGNTTINGTLSPGQSPGTLNFSGDLTLLANSIYTFEAGDLVAVGGTLTLTDNWTLALGGGFTDGGSVTIFTYGFDGGFDLVPTFDITNLGFSPSGALSLSDTGSSIVLNGLTVVPEPGAVLISSLGLLALLRRRR